jgi:hypothetical protein
MNKFGKVLIGLGIGIALLSGLSCSNGGRDLNVKPNIIYILSHDIGIGKVTPYGMGPNRQGVVTG